MSLRLKNLCYLFVVIKMSMPTISFLIQQGRPSFYSNRLHDFSATILDVTSMLMLSASFFIKQERSAYYSDRLHEVSAIILCYKDAIVNCFCPHKVRALLFILIDCMIFLSPFQVLCKCQCNHFSLYSQNLECFRCRFLSLGIRSK